MKEQSSVLNNIIGDCIQMNTDLINQYNDSKLPKFIIKLLILRKKRENIMIHIKNLMMEELSKKESL